MHQFLIFAFRQYYPSGGIGDLKGIKQGFDESRDFVTAIANEGEYDRFQIVKVEGSVPDEYWYYTSNTLEGDVEVCLELSGESAFDFGLSCDYDYTVLGSKEYRASLGLGELLP